MRPYVTFRHSAELIPLSDEDGVVAARGADWFVALLRRIPGFSLDDELVQEDWGVVLFARFEQKQFWLGLSYWPEGEQVWLAHVHQRGFFQRFGPSGRRALEGLLAAVDAVLVGDPAVSDVAWYEEGQMAARERGLFDGPVGDKKPVV